MTILNVVVYVALIGYVIFSRFQGQPVKAGRKLFLLPVLLIVLGYGDVTQGTTMKPIEITLTVIAGVISLGLGLLRGRADKLSDRGGYPFVQWGAASLILFVGNLAAKLVLDLIGLATGSASSVVGKSLLLTFGLTLLGEAIVVWMRTGGATGLLNPARASVARPRQPSINRPIEVTPPAEPPMTYQTGNRANAPAQAGAKPASSTTPARSLADAIQQHHHHHHHDHKHDRRR